MTELSSNWVRVASPSTKTAQQEESATKIKMPPKKQPKAANKTRACPSISPLE